MVSEFFWMVEPSLPFLDVGVPSGPIRSGGFLRCFPFGEFGLPVRALGFDFLFQRVDFTTDGLDRFGLLVAVDPRFRFVGVIEKGEQPEVFFMADGVELMRVALGALERESNGRFSEGVDAVENAFEAELLDDDGAFFVDHAVAHESAGDELVLGAVGDEIAGELFDQKLVIGHVGVERIDDPVAIDPLFARLVLFETIGVSVARDIEPLAGPFFAEGRSAHEFVDQSVNTRLGLGAVSFDEGFDFLRAGRESNEIEMDAPNKRVG